MNKYRKFIAGSTMIEMMITVAILAIMAALATPSYSDFVEKRKLTGGAEKIAAFMNLARNSAVKHNQQITVGFTSGTDWCLGMTLGPDACDCAKTTVSHNDYCALKYTDNSGTSVIETQLISSENYSGFQLIEATTGVGDDGDNSALTFDPIRGILADLSDIASITVQSTNTNHELKVNVSATGAVKTCTNGAPLTGFKLC